jgi:hypothetical protein
MAKHRGGRFKKMLGLGFISFEKAFNLFSRPLPILPALHYPDLSEHLGRNHATLSIVPKCEVQ